jgi:oligopeptidase B
MPPVRSRPRLLITALACLPPLACDQRPGGEAIPAQDPMYDSKPPSADIRPYTVVSPHGDRVDHYYWLRDDDREDPDVLAYLAAENVYKTAQLAPVKELETRLYDEIVGRIAKDDSTVPARHRGYWYYERYEGDGEYPIIARRRDADGAPEEIMLDVNALARGHDYYDVGDYDVSPDNRLLAYAEDTGGRNIYTIRFRNLATGATLPDRLPGNEASLAWGGDSRTLFYIEKDPTTLLGVRVRRHRLGDDPPDDALVYEEHDDSFYMGLGTTGDDRYVTLHLTSTVTDELRYLPVEQPGGEFAVLYPRERDHEYDADHVGERWVIRTNWQATNFRIMTAADDAAQDRAGWAELVPHDDAVFLGEFDAFRDFIAIAERHNGLRRLRVLSWDGELDFPVDADDHAYVMGINENPEQDSDWLRYSYSSLTTPDTIYELNVRTKERRRLKQDRVLGGFDAMNYRTERLWATARDGARVPVTVVYRKSFAPDGTAPLYQHGYGAYGISRDPDFDVDVLSLLDRGFVYAIAHVRGGQEMGRRWYDDGKLLKKLNTFTDFIDVTEFLVREGYAHPDKVIGLGRSAGGLLIGAIANMRPDLYRILIADVPFVDAVTTMLDESIPLTTGEFDEWGNPMDEVFYDYMLSYSPYDNVAAQDYPAMFITTGLWDSAVQYFEPAKWVAKLRALKTDDNRLLLHVNMDAGHTGQSGRFRANRELAMQYAFILDELGMAEGE